MSNETDVLELDSSTSASDVIVQSADTPTDDAASSTAQSDQQADTLSIVRDVVGERKEEPAEVGSQPAEQEGKVEQTEEEQPKEGSQPEDYSDVPFHKHPRFQQLLREKKTAEVDATRYRNVQNFLDENGVSPTEAADALLITGLIKTNPAAAWQQLKPIVQSLLVAAGEVLPDDLRQRVHTGEMSQEAAMEFSRVRAQHDSFKNSVEWQRQQEENRRQQTLVQSLVSTAESWEADRRSKDPNFDAKFVPLQKELMYLQSVEGKPSTPEGVRDQLKRAYDSVVLPAAVAPATRPAPRPTTPVRSSTSGQAPSDAQPVAQTTAEIIQRELARRA